MCGSGEVKNPIEKRAESSPSMVCLQLSYPLLTSLGEVEDRSKGLTDNYGN